MGSASLPGFTGQEMGVIYQMIEEHPLFKGWVKVNFITRHYTRDAYDPPLPENRVEIGKDRRPILVIWISMDDFLIHVLTHKLCCEAVSLAMEALLKLGILAFPLKDNSITLIQHLQTHPPKCSRLDLAIVICRLQRLVPATTGNVGATYLQYLYNVIHEDMGDKLLPSSIAYYCQIANMTEQSYEELEQWLEYLLSTSCELS
eukprot:10615793-Ditylum_brightwellii.AAC.1